MTFIKYHILISKLVNLVITHFANSQFMYFSSFLIAAFSYEQERRLRVTIVHGMARMAALISSTYKAYLGVGLGPFEVVRN